MPVIHLALSHHDALVSSHIIIRRVIWVCWSTIQIPALSLRPEDGEFKANQNYIKILFQENKQSHKAGHWWLMPMPVIVATQKSEIRKITVQNQPRQTVHETLSFFFFF
jgi:hypothetical protein